jgi:1-deoxy-D-xylulose-5-phosphate reductoisomerase
MMKHVAILGSTGSIGTSALAVADAHPDRLRIIGLAAGANAPMLAAQIARYRPQVVALAEGAAGALAATGVSLNGAAIHDGAEGLVAVATHPDADIVLCATSGTAALEAVLAAIDAGKTIALANKEVLVMAGEVVIEAARRRGVAVLPVDSEHNAIHQCLHGRTSADVTRLVLTASGGPFRSWSAGALRQASAADALRHPTWQMGRKITIDSATLMNKGLEVIEAHWLFGVTRHQIDVVVHPQSVVHSLVELRDGSMIAQLGVTDMRLPIQYAFSYPDRWGGATPRLDLASCGPLEFHEPDHERFPCLGLAYGALDAGGTMPVVLNAANEVAVEAFLQERLGFTAIADVIAAAMHAHRVAPATTLAAVRAADHWAREYSRALVDTRAVETLRISS